MIGQTSPDSPRQRVLGLAVAAVLSAACAAAAVLAAWMTIQVLAQDRLGSVAGLILTRFEALDREVQSTLDTFNRQPERFCSAEELDHLREAVYRTRYIKDVGRLKERRLVCTGSLQMIAAPPLVPVPQARTKDGLGVSPAEPVLVARESRAPILERGATNVVLDPATFIDEPLIGMDYSAGYLSETGRYVRLYGRAILPVEDDTGMQGPFARDGTLYYRLCARDRALCVTTSLRKPDLFHQHALLLGVCGLLGLVAGVAGSALTLVMWARRNSIDARLRDAVSRRALMLEYQPIVALADGRIVGAEALIRWRDQTGRAIPPAVFIPVAERIGEIRAITDFVIGQAFADFASSLKDKSLLGISLNISVQDLADDAFFETLAKEIERWSLDTKQISLELTEHSTEARDVVTDGIRRLRRRGHRIHIDDFGTGYSSLSYLNELQVDALKIDRSFTQTVGGDTTRITVVPQILDIARTLGLEVIVEGVEEVEQADWFRGSGAGYAQGWMFGRPISAAAFKERLAAQASAKPASA